jgi:endoglucanase
MSGSSMTAFEQNRRLGRGVNIRPTSESRSPKRIQERHFELIKQAGFDSVRVVMNPWGYADAASGQVVTGDWLKTLDWTVDQSLANGLLPILDFHDSMSREPEANHERYLETWRVLAAHCQNLPDTVLFELLNEPSRNLTAELWNQYLAEAHAIVRETNPDRTLIIGPIFMNRTEYLDVMELPEDDRNIIATVHYYFPHSFTHQGAAFATSWGQNHDVEWLGTPAEKEAIEWTFSKAQYWSKSHDRPIYLGEFGVYDAAPMDSRVRWLSFVTRHAEELGWSWGYWQFLSDFVLYDIEKEQWIQPVLDALIPPQG